MAALGSAGELHGASLEIKELKMILQRTSLTRTTFFQSVTKFGVVAALSRQIMQQAAGGKKSATPESHALPIMVYYHGGGLVSGNRAAWTPNWLFRECYRMAEHAGRQKSSIDL